MGVSTNGIIFYGLVFEEEFEFPWDDYDNDIDDWWKEVKGFTPTFNPFTPDGNYVNGVKEKDPRVDVYFNEMRTWEAVNPIPVEIVDYCSNEYPMYALAVPGTVVECRRGCPTEISISTLDWDVTKERLMWEFLEEYGIEHEDQKMKWYLASYWG